MDDIIAGVPLKDKGTFDQVFVREDCAVAEGKALHRPCSGIGRIGVKVAQVNFITAAAHPDDQCIVTVGQPLGNVSQCDLFAEDDAVSLARRGIIVDSIHPFAALVDIPVVAIAAG